MRRTDLILHRNSKLRGHVLKDPAIMFAQGRGGRRTLLRAGIVGNSHGSFSQPRTGKIAGTENTKHAFPLLTHTDFGFHDQAADTKYVELGNYMPKRAKGTPPWWRGADTYSPLYTEQGRYEYQRYLMIARFPAHYKRHFQTTLSAIRGTHAGARARAKDYVLPQEALHHLLRMIVDNYNPQHCHYLAAMQALMSNKEYDMARDVWRIMERQQTWPDDKLIASYLELCALAGEKTWAIECWNRYCNEKSFLGENEADPKPVSRVPFTLNRDELLYLPKWKKFFDHDPNLDVADLNRFNTTRNIYRWMVVTLAVTGEAELMDKFLAILEESLLTTRTPVPEPPNPQLLRQQSHWGADPNRDSRRSQQWTPTINTKKHCEIAEMNARYLSNEQFLIRTVTDVVDHYCRLHPAHHQQQQNQLQQGQPPAVDEKYRREALEFCDKMFERLNRVLEKNHAASGSKLNRNSLLATILSVHRNHAAPGSKIGDDLQKLLFEKLVKKSSSSTTSDLVVHSACYLEILRGYADQTAPNSNNNSNNNSNFDPKQVVMKVTELVSRLAESPNFEWTGDHHLAIVRVLSNCGTMNANKYFVTNVLRKFRWTSEFLEALYLEHRRHPDADTWSELTKRMLVWTERYNVKPSETLLRMIEDDYDIIKVQTRSFREVAVFAFRDAAERKEAQDPASQLPNPVMDYVSHALPFPDRDNGYPNEYGDVGQWRDPQSGIKGPDLWAPPMHEEAHRGYTAEWRDNTATANAVKMPAPWDKKYVEYNRGRHPSYDQIYAGPFPEIFPGRHDFRKPTRWDFQAAEKQSKFRVPGPY